MVSDLLFLEKRAFKFSAILVGTASESKRLEDYIIKYLHNFYIL